MFTTERRKIVMKYVCKPYSEQRSCERGSRGGCVYFWLREVWFICISLPFICVDLVQIILASLTYLMCRCCNWIPFPSKYTSYISDSDEWLDFFSNQTIINSIQGHDKKRFQNGISNSQEQEPRPVILDRGDDQNTPTSGKIEMQTIKTEVSDIQQNGKSSHLQIVEKVIKDSIQGHDNMGYESDRSNSQEQEPRPKILEHDEEPNIRTSNEIKMQRSVFNTEASDIQQYGKISSLQKADEEVRDLLREKFNWTKLHQAVMENNVNAFLDETKKSAPDQIKQMFKEETTLEFGSNFKKGARFPLALAVLSGSKDSVDELIKADADLDQQDMYGYTVFHTVVLMSATDYEAASEMYDFLIDQAKIWWGKTMGNKNVSADPKLSEMEAVYYLLNLKTKKRQLTPLELAASLGYKEIMEKILNTEYAYKFTIFRSKKREIAFYDVRHIDPVLNVSRVEPSVVELIVASENDNALECFDIPLVNRFLSRKWDNYFLYFVAEAVAYFIYVCVYTSNIYHATYIQNTTKSGSSSDYSFKFKFSAAEIFLLGGVIIYALLGLTSMVSTMKQLIQRQIQYGSIYLLWRRFLVAAYIIVSSSILFIWFGAKIKGLAIQRIFQVLALIFGWTFLIFFMHGFRRTAFFSVMVERLLVKDVLIFAVCYSLITMGFASAIVVNVRFNGEYPPNYKDIENAFFSLFRMTFGMADAEELFDREKFTRTTYGLNIVIFTAYIILCLLLLLNMLIACMSDTYAMISTQRHLFWKRLRAFNIYLIEYRLPSILQRFSSYYPVKTYKIKGKDGNVFERDVYMFSI